MTNNVRKIVISLGKILMDRDLMVGTAESCTGGGIASTLTSVPGSSHWFDRGFVTYSNQSKIDCLGVESSVLDKFGAVSSDVVLQMVKGGIARSDASVFIAVSGIAGPGGGTKEKPVGTVFIGWGYLNVRGNIKTRVKKYIFEGDRAEIRSKAVFAAIEGVQAILI